jgi:hypothetical protein
MPDFVVTKVFDTTQGRQEAAPDDSEGTGGSHLVQNAPLRAKSASQLFNGCTSSQIQQARHDPQQMSTLVRAQAILHDSCLRSSLSGVEAP